MKVFATALLAFLYGCSEHSVQEPPSNQAPLKTSPVDPVTEFGNELIANIQKLRESLKAALETPVDELRGARRDYIAKLMAVLPHISESDYPILEEVATTAQLFFEALRDDHSEASRLYVEMDRKLLSLIK